MNPAYAKEQASPAPRLVTIGFIADRDGTGKAYENTYKVSPSAVPEGVKAGAISLLAGLSAFRTARPAAEGGQ